MLDKFATLTLDGETLELPVQSGTLGPDVISVGKLAPKYFTFDPGFISTASCESKITFIDGAKGGFNVAIGIIPYLIAMLCAIALFRASGALDVRKIIFLIQFLMEMRLGASRAL